MTTDLKLYQITEQLLAVGAKMLDADGEMTLEMEQELAGWEADFETKVVMVANFIKKLEADAEQAVEEAKSQYALAKPRQNTAERLKVYLRMQMEAANFQKVDTPNRKVWLQNNPPSVRCDIEPERLPANLVRMKLEIDKSAILEQHKAGTPLPQGVEVVQGRSLRIK